MQRLYKYMRMPSLIGVFLALAGTACGDSIALKASVRLQQRSDVVRLADIAVLEGAEAQRHADLVVHRPQDPAVTSEVTVQMVRSALEQAGVHWGKVDLSGRRTIVRPARTLADTPPLAMTALALDGAESAEQEVAEARFARDEVAADRIVDLPTLRGTIAKLVATGLHVKPAALRLAFDRSDAEFLDTPIAAGGMRYEVHPLSSIDSDRLELAVRTWSDGRVAASRNVTVHPRVLTHTAALLRDVRRNTVITADDLEVKDKWLAPSQAALHCGPAEAAGRLAARSLRAGDTLRDPDLRRPALIERGSRVTVRCLVGGVAISMQAEAREEGAEGDLIELRKLGERDTFFAIVTAPGEAVVDLSRRPRTAE
ncbi:MAG: flagellar basal body P-ring formation protein FlgA [Phycisphaerales bacterium]|nr:MAG: flagellar basal body P-ring formation protein FlgA [Phycisphaerales bacterium]